MNGLKNLIYLNLARNRLQFHQNQHIFQDLNSLEILNLDRNIQLNLTKTTFLGLENPFDVFENLQRLKLSSNYLKELPLNFLFHSKNSLISIDLQRNLFQSIPNLFGNNLNSSKLMDFDLSSNHICSITKHQLYKYKNLKTIGLTGNPLHCNCHLKWIKQWLIKNYDYDLIKFLQWTCATPEKLSGKQLTIIDEQEMICTENDYSQCQNFQSIITTTTTTTQSTSTSSIDELIINDISYNPNGMLTITWDYMISILPKYIHLQIYDENNRYVIFQSLIDGEQRSIEIDIKNYIKEDLLIYMICLSIRNNKYCRNIQLQQMKSSNLILSSKKLNNNTQQSLQFIYLLGGIFLGAIFVCIILIIICYWRIRHISKTKLKNSIEKLPTTNTLYHPPLHSSIFYRPLNIISYPQQQQQQQSCDTSECSIHSSTDTSQLANDSYHIYQQIPSVYNCQIHPTRTHILI